MKKIPEFKSEAEEFEFWSKADSAEYIDWPQAGRAKIIGIAASKSGRSPSDLAPSSSRIGKQWRNAAADPSTPFALLR
jgi:hypothetical protein